MASSEIRVCTADEAVSAIKSNDRVYVGSNCGQPVTLCEALTRRRGALRGVELFHLLTFGPAPYVDPDCQGSFRHTAFFIAGNTREAVQARRADYLPVFLSDVPSLFDQRLIPLDVALIAVTPPDESGFCSLGVSVDLAVSACRNAELVIAEIQPEMPWTHGGSCIHVSEIDVFCRSEHGLLEHPSDPPDAVSRQIGQQVRALVTDGCCI